MNINAYYCIDDIGLANEVGEMLKMSILSAVQNSGLNIKCLYCGVNKDFISTLQNIGVEVIEHKSRIDQLIIDAHKSINFPLHARGAYLRYDIPLVDENEYSLYVDCDVFFAKKFIFPPEMPTHIAACKEKGDSIDYNSGVLLINNQAFRKTSDGFLSYASSKFGSWSVGVDQRPFNDFYIGKIEELPGVYNWRASFGINDDAIMVHFHGTKIEEIYAFLINNIPEPYANGYLLERASVCSVNLDSVAYYLDVFSKYLSANTSPEFSQKISKIIERYNSNNLSRDIFIKNANSFAIESNFLLFIDKFPHNCKKKAVLPYAGDAGYVHIYPAQNFFVGSIIITFVGVDEIPSYVLFKSTGYLKKTFKGNSIAIQFCSTSFASALVLNTNDLRYEKIEIQVEGLCVGVTTIVDSFGNKVEIKDLL